MNAPDLPSAGPRSPAEGSTTGWVSPSAVLLALRRERATATGCAGGRHYMRRDPDGPVDRPWRCVDCDTQRPWVGAVDWLRGAP